MFYHQILLNLLLFYSAGLLISTSAGNPLFLVPAWGISLFYLYAHQNLNERGHIYLPCLFALFLGWSHPSPPNHQAAALKTSIFSQVDGKMVVMEGICSSFPLPILGGQRFVFQAERLFFQDQEFQVEKKILLTGYFKKGMPAIEPYSRLIIKAKLYLPPTQMNPGGFNYSAFLAKKKILLTGQVISCQSLTLTTTLSLWQKIAGKFYIIKKRLTDFILAGQFINPKRAIILALLCGVTSTLKPETRELTSSVGIAHLLAISGFHLFLMITTAHFLLKRILKLFPALLLRFSAPFLTSLAQIPIIIFYTLFTGAHISTVRAAIMAILFYLQPLLGLKSKSSHFLTLAALALLLQNHQRIDDVGFLLSFFATYGLVCLAGTTIDKPGNYGHRGIIERVLLFLWQILFTTWCAFVCTLPIIHYFFFKVPLIGQITNFAAIPLVSFWIIPWASAAGIISFFSPCLAQYFLFAALKGVEILIWFCQKVVAIPYSFIYLPPPPIWELLLYYLLLGLLVNLKEQLKLTGGKITWLLLLVWLLGRLLFWVEISFFQPNDGKMNIHFLAVGHGDAVFIEFPDGKNMLIDGGGDYRGRLDTGKRHILPFLLTRQVTKIDFMMLSHPHPDHLLGLLTPASIFPVQWFIHSDQTVEWNKYDHLINLLKKQGTSFLRFNKSFNQFSIGRVNLKVLHPLRPPNQPGYYPQLSLNDNSLVIQIQYGQFKLLLTGDIEEEGQKIVAPLIKEPVTVLKVPHHGSETSLNRDFLYAAKPQFAVIQCGRHHNFNFPRPRVVETYNFLGSKILRTDQLGLISISTDGVSLSLRLRQGAETWYRLNPD